VIERDRKTTRRGRRIGGIKGEKGRNAAKPRVLAPRTGQQRLKQPCGRLYFAGRPWKQRDRRGLPV